MASRAKDRGSAIGINDRAFSMVTTDRSADAGLFLSSHSRGHIPEDSPLYFTEDCPLFLLLKQQSCNIVAIFNEPISNKLLICRTIFKNSFSAGEVE